MKESTEEPLTPLLTDGSSGDKLLEVRMSAVMAEAFELWKARHRKYGRLNISMFQEVGCVVRAGDKISRLAEALIKHKGAEEMDETVEDSFKDLANYALMGLLCHRGLWSAPTVESGK